MSDHLIAPFTASFWYPIAAKEDRVKYWEIIGDKLSKAGWGWDCAPAIDANGRTIFDADAHRDDGMFPCACR
jgi:hypothetical protein